MSDNEKQELAVEIGVLSTKLDTVIECLEKNDVSGMKADVGWLKSFALLMCGAVISNIFGIVYLLIKK